MGRIASRELAALGLLDGTLPAASEAAIRLFARSCLHSLDLDCRQTFYLRLLEGGMIARVRAFPSERVFPYLCRVVRNVVADLGRADARFQRLRQHAAGVVRALAPSSAALAAARDDLKRLVGLLAGLPPTQRASLSSRYASELGAFDGTVLVRAAVGDRAMRRRRAAAARMALLKLRRLASFEPIGAMRAFG